MSSGPTPLEYFLTGALMCLLNQFIKLSLARYLALESIKTTGRAHIRPAIEGSLVDMVFDVYLQGSADPEAIRTLGVDAE